MTEAYVYVFAGAFLLCLASVIAELVVLGRKNAELEKQIGNLITRMGSMAIRIDENEREFISFRDGEAKDIAEALAKSEKREEAFIDGFNSIINYSIAEAYGRKDEDDGR